MESKFSKKGQQPFLVLDIGTEAVKALIVRKSYGKTSILNSSLQYFTDEGIFNKGFSEDEFEMEIIKRAVLAVKEELLIKKPISVILTLSQKVLKAKVVEGLSVREKREKKISKKEQEIIYKYVLKAAKDDVLKEVSEKSGILAQDIKFISLDIIDKEIEGYKVPDIQNYQGKNLAFKILAVFIIDSYLQRISEILEELGMKVLKIVHLAEAVKVVFSEKVKDGVFFDIGGEAVQAFFIQKGTLESVDLFNRGGADFTERIFDVLTIDKEEARRLKEKYSKGDLSLETGNRIKELFSNEKKIWRNLFRKNQKSSVFLFGGGSSLPEIKDMFRRRQIVSIKNLESVEDLSEKTKSPQFIPSILIFLTW
jgi:cell division ATPase FtsA